MLATAGSRSVCARGVPRRGCAWRGLALLLALVPLPGRAQQQGGAPAPLRWLAELGAEGHLAVPRPSPAGAILWVSVPGAALSFAVAQDGSLVRQRRVASDFASGHGLATSERGAVVADRDGAVALFARAAAGGDELRWRRELGARIQSVAWDGGDRVWATTREGTLLALRSEDGSTLWSAALAGRAEAPPVGSARAVFAASKSGTLQRLDAATGALHWTARLDGPALHSPLLAEARDESERALVYCASWSGTLFAFDADSGAPAWSAPLGARLASAPVLLDGGVAVADASGTVHAYGRGGAPLWQAAGAVDGPASLLALPAEATAGGESAGGSASARLIAVSRRIAALDAASGRPLQSYPEGAAEELRQRFLHAMMEGERAPTESEKRAAQEREAFALAGLLFGAPRLQPGGLAFGTEEGWVYRFDARSLRPTFRYRAGVPASALHRGAGRHIVVSAGEELFALSPRTGGAQWRRSVGGSIEALAGSELLAVLTAERLIGVDARDGARRWTQSLPADFVAGERAQGGPDSWWVSQAPGRLQLVDSRGGLREALAVEGHLLPPVPLPDAQSWLGATREGRVFRFRRVEPQPGAAPDAAPGFQIAWQRELGAPLSGVAASGAAALVRLASGVLVRLDADAGDEIWRLPLDVKEDYALAEGEHVFWISSNSSLRMHDLQTARLLWTRALEAPALCAQLRSGALHWVDRSGRAHRADAASGALLESRDLGLALESAAALPDGFVVQTSAGEVGFAELAGEPAQTATPARGEFSEPGDPDAGSSLP